MGKTYDSSLTRVAPFFQALVSKKANPGFWLPKLLLSATRNTEYARELAHKIRKADSSFRGLGGVPATVTLERELPPPRAFLSWLIRHPERLNWEDYGKNRSSFGEKTRKKRDQLKAGGPSRNKIIREATEELVRFGSESSRRKWWAFEGFTSVDCFIETDEIVLLVEGKRTEKVSSATMWYPQRNQVIRNIEVAREVAGPDRDYAVLLVMEEEPSKPVVNERILQESLPHMIPEERQSLSEHYLGETTWAILCNDLGIPFENLPDTVSDVSRSLKEKVKGKKNVRIL
jgi:hypothetical protein